MGGAQSLVFLSLLKMQKKHMTGTYIKQEKGGKKRTNS